MRRTRRPGLQSGDSVTSYAMAAADHWPVRRFRDALDRTARNRSGADRPGSAGKAV